MKKLALIILFVFSSAYSLMKPKAIKKRKNKKHTYTQRINPKKHTSKVDKAIEKIRLANPGQNAKLLLRSPLHLRTFFPGTQVYAVR